MTGRRMRRGTDELSMRIPKLAETLTGGIASYLPTREKIKEHTTPTFFDDTKLNDLLFGYQGGRGGEYMRD